MNNSQLDSKLLEVSSKLKMRETELANLKENNKQLIKHLHDQKRGEMETQVTNYLLAYVTVCSHRLLECFTI